ncbi:MAG: 1-acyl-sn-glycerol-3-phosphate acyltransferase [Pseudomonadota bacterium]
MDQKLEAPETTLPPAASGAASQHAAGDAASASAPAPKPEARAKRVAAPRENGKHIIEVLIEERCVNLRKSPFWPLMRTVLYPVLKKGEAVRMAEAVAPMTGAGVMDHVARVLDLDIQITGLENIPKEGRVLLAPTHPTGIADGVAVWDALRGWRDDMMFFANRDAIRAAPQLDEILIPVEWVMEKRTRERSRETLKVTRAAFKEEKCVILFPSGRLAYMDDDKVLTEQEWQNSVAIFAGKYKAPIIPVNVRARNSWLYYWFWRLNDELRDITLFHELLNKKRKRFEITVGKPIPVDALKGDHDEVAAALRAHALNDVPAGKPWTPLG